MSAQSVADRAVSQRLALTELSESGAAAQRAGVALGTVHRLQGGERSIVLFSSVISHPASLAFLNARPNLLNVAISRERHHSSSWATPQCSPKAHVPACSRRTRGRSLQRPMAAALRLRCSSRNPPPKAEPGASSVSSSSYNPAAAHTCRSSSKACSRRCQSMGSFAKCTLLARRCTPLFQRTSGNSLGPCDNRFRPQPTCSTRPPGSSLGSYCWDMGFPKWSRCIDGVRSTAASCCNSHSRGTNKPWRCRCKPHYRPPQHRRLPQWSHLLPQWSRQRLRTNRLLLQLGHPRLPTNPLRPRSSHRRLQ